MNARTPALDALLASVASDMGLRPPARRRAAPNAAPAPIETRETWTPETVEQALVDALTWVRSTGGPVGPRGFSRSQSRFVRALGWEDEWGVVETADDDEPPQVRIQASAERVTFFEAALEWPARYLCPDHVGSARCVGLWARCKARKASFAHEAKARGLARRHAYTLKDRGLSMIAQGLERDGVAAPQSERL
ncbi:hypothetical protein [Cereibacter azotoformans]|uniref:hypothetical protein n=1 Tax=Cereibacter azotoformans TaxID=43057 RepID=UPI000C6C9B48|nr:hypothetical protein [Cereibacter azotoformans]